MSGRDRRCKIYRKKSFGVMEKNKNLWTTRGAMKFKTSLLKIALDHLENNAEDALCKFVECLTSAGSCMLKKCYDNKKVMKAK